MLKTTYAERAGTFMSNAGVIQTFGVNDHAAADMLSRTIGNTTIGYEAFGSSHATTRIQPANRTTMFTTATPRRARPPRPMKSYG